MWGEGDTVYFQRYDAKEGQAQGRIRHLGLGSEFQVGREQGSGNDYILGDDARLTGRHFKIKVSRGEGDVYILVAQDLNSLNGTTVEWNEPQGLAGKDKIVDAMHAEVDLPEAIKTHLADLEKAQDTAGLHRTLKLLAAAMDGDHSILQKSGPMDDAKIQSTIARLNELNASNLSQENLSRIVASAGRQADYNPIIRALVDLMQPGTEGKIIGAMYEAAGVAAKVKLTPRFFDGRSLLRRDNRAALEKFDNKISTIQPDEVAVILIKPQSVTRGEELKEHFKKFGEKVIVLNVDNLASDPEVYNYFNNILITNEYRKALFGEGLILHDGRKYLDKA